MKKALFYVSVILSLQNSIAMEARLQVDSGNALANLPQKPYNPELYQKGLQTAREEATFTFQVIPPSLPFSPFTLHLTHHRLPFDILNPYTKKLISDANTIVIEPSQIEDEPLDKRDEYIEVFKKLFVDKACHQKIKEELKSEDYERLRYFCIKVVPKLFEAGYFVQFEELNASCFCFYLRQILFYKKACTGMDLQIESFALNSSKILTGLDFFFGDFISLGEQRVQAFQKDRLDHFLFQDISFYLNEIDNLSSEPLVKDSDDTGKPWNVFYKQGNFFSLSLLADQENEKADVDCVYARNLQWIPRIKEIISSPARYLAPISINVGYGHHGLLGKLEKEKFEIMILNKNGEWYPFSYLQSYADFRKLSDCP